ncbi:unnamed protein product [Clavelina lepadiformis]|uniref:Uncharacterized protein n=1 Tax=Clavelina lepadiformis TaxID=159417 RepID=A0ABP0G7T4_CLALP
MPSMNFDYTNFLKRQNALYLLKYQNDPIIVAENPTPIPGYSGHVPNYRSSLHEHRLVRSLVRCLDSPMKPTTATGFIKRQPLPELSNSPNKAWDKEGTESHKRRSKSAPPTTAHAKTDQKEQVFPESQQESGFKESNLTLSRIALMSAGSSDKVRSGQNELPTKTNQDSRHLNSNSLKNASNNSCGAAFKVFKPNRPAGYSETVYGSSFWFAWPEMTENNKSERSERHVRDRKLNRNDHVIYHKHEGVVPKYMGYVPGYKFRHGSTYGVLTCHATSLGKVHKL